MLNKFLPKGAQGVIGTLIIWVLLDIKTIHYWRDINLEEMIMIWRPYLLTILAIIVIYAVIYKKFRYSRNKIIITLKKFSGTQFWSIFISLASLNFFWDIIKNFHNIEITGSGFPFIISTALHLILALLGGLMTLIFRDKQFIILSKVNFLYLAIKEQNLGVKIFNGTAYFLFLLYLLGYLLTYRSSVITKGQIIDSYQVASAYAGPGGPGSRSHLTVRQIVILHDGQTEKYFTLTKQEGLKCQWSKHKTATIQHHVYWYSAVWSNKVLACD